MTLSEELQWRGFQNQTTIKSITDLDTKPFTLYLGMDPSADSLTIGNLAVAMMIRHFINHGHKAVMLVGGATGLIGDPDGKKEERNLKSLEEIAKNKRAIAGQYNTILSGKEFTLVDNYDWFKDIGYLEFLRDVGKHVPMRQMLSREFVQSRLGEEGTGISYAEFSYALIQGYDFVHLYREYGVNLQICGADQWGNSIAGVDLVRRMEGGEVHVWSAPLVVNKSTGVKFGKTEGGAVWLDPVKTSPTQFYQFWINLDDAGIEDYAKIYTILDKSQIDEIMQKHWENPRERFAQRRVAEEVTAFIHGHEAMQIAQKVTDVITGKIPLAEAEDVLDALRGELPSVTAQEGGSVVESLVATGLASSNTEARRLLAGNAIAINGAKSTEEKWSSQDFQNGLVLLRRGKALKDTVLIEITR
ncbi:MAG: tyrosyl-tRNA synthetase [Patescibacteria group bacterium]|nr:tyrosine--tRNA ligase [Candidatus Saccharibacteria bacterium]MDQ5962953.1 tyrosyl-tRNA synthetase [Patescibacteria group bacterium]